MQFIDDSYNANPDSMKAALHTLMELDADGKRIAVLGEMGELGEESARGHREVGETAAELGVDQLIAIGDMGATIAQAAQQAGLARTAAVGSISEAAEMLTGITAPGDLVLIKGSRAARTEACTRGIRKAATDGGRSFMMYYLHRLSDQFVGFNVFFYVTFRSVAAAVTAFAVSLNLRELRHSQVDGAQVGPTDSLGGRSPSAGRIALWQARHADDGRRAHHRRRFPFQLSLGASRQSLRLARSCSACFISGALGFADDYLKVTKKKSAGISGRFKLLFQIILAAIVTAVFLTSPLLEVQARSLYLPFFKAPVITNMGWFTFLFFALVIVGSSNAVNLTDGLDGLAIGCTVTVAFAYALLSYAAGNFRIAEYLQVPFYPFTGELTVVCAALVGAGFGFLWFNCYPAKVFMGDTGSLAIGGMIGVVAICCKQELLLMVVGGVFVVEAVSVILQVLSFKLTGRRIFAMSPIHHHFELVGWKENTVIVRFWILSGVFALLGLATLKLR